ncbi:MAG TPA: efflux RND transporter periplasmic adaptor subunit, partial [Burkholderiales bacterium]|nr:efflux RND transporter periplasmic adaptor subunit [Burkholderiales bacterium]
MKPFWKTFLVICVLGGGAFYWWKLQPSAKAPGTAMTGEIKAKGAGRRGGGPVTVKTIPVMRKAMPVVIDAVGTVESEHSVAVRPQVNGVLDAVLFREGDRIRKGQALFRIDSRPMRAAVEQARAAVARDEAQLAQAKAQEARLRPLIEKDYITRQEYDVATTQAKALEATVAANRAVLEQAQLQLSYAFISAPISGRTGSLSVKAGNLVSAGGATPLVVINSTQPMLVSLSVPERYLDDVRRHWNTPDLKVEISSKLRGPVVATGSLVFIDNTVNLQTGTVLLKAQFKNEKEELWAGQFVQARIVLRVEKDALVLPESAVQPGQDRPFVYVAREGKAAAQEVQVGRQVGDLVVISSGLTGSERVIADVPPTLADGTPIKDATDGATKAAAEVAREEPKGNGKVRASPPKS